MTNFNRRCGKALSFITREDWRYARELCNVLQDASQVRLHWLDLEMCLHIIVQVVPDDLIKMAERYEAWKQRKDAEKESCGGGGSRGRGSRYNRF